MAFGLCESHVLPAGHVYVAAAFSALEVGTHFLVDCPHDAANSKGHCKGSGWVLRATLCCMHKGGAPSNVSSACLSAAASLLLLQKSPKQQTKETLPGASVSKEGTLGCRHSCAD